MKDCFDSAYNSVLGYRCDEPNRNLTKATKDLTAIAPMRDDPTATRERINEFWSNHSFTLNLPEFNGRTLGGNCDMCFLKGQENLMETMRGLEKAGLKDRIYWWIKLEGKTTNFLVNGTTYKLLYKRSKYNPLSLGLIPREDAEDSCFCTD